MKRMIVMMKGLGSIKDITIFYISEVIILEWRKLGRCLTVK